MGEFWSRVKDSNFRNPGPKPGGIAANRTRDCLVPLDGIEPPNPAYKAGPLSLRIKGRIF
jgi:hypothetical protein